MTKKCLKKSIWRSIDGLQLVIYCCQGYRMPRAINIHNHIITQWPTTCLDKDKGNLHEMLNSVKTLERAQIFTSTCSPMCICVSSLYLNEHEQIFIMVMERALPFLLLWILAPSRIQQRQHADLKSTQKIPSIHCIYTSQQRKNNYIHYCIMLPPIEHSKTTNKAYIIQRQDAFTILPMAQPSLDRTLGLITNTIRKISSKGLRRTAKKSN